MSNTTLAASRHHLGPADRRPIEDRSRKGSNVYLAYIDESGSTGDVAKGGSKSYTLGCVLVRASQWAGVLDGLIGDRRHLKKQFGLLARAEMKANHVLQNGGAFRNLALSERARHALYRGALRLCPKLDLKAFAIVIRKELITGTGGARLSEVNQRSGGPSPGIVAWPKPK